MTREIFQLPLQGSSAPSGETTPPSLPVSPVTCSFDIGPETLLARVQCACADQSCPASGELNVGISRVAADLMEMRPASNFLNASTTLDAYVPYVDYKGGLQVGGRMITNLRYADDIILLATSEAELQELVHRLDRVSRKYSLLINVDKTKVMASDGIACRILIHNELLEQVDTFPYLGSLIQNMVSVRRNSAPG